MHSLKISVNQTKCLNSTFNPIANRAALRPISRSLSKDAGSSSSSVSYNGEETLQKVPISELPGGGKPSPKAIKTINKHNTKTGVGKLLVDTLAGTSFVIIGDDTDLNWAVAQQLSSRLGWFPTQTSKVVAGMTGSTRSRLGQEEDTVVNTEGSVLRGLKMQRRVVISTMAGGAASKFSTYRDLWGAIIVRVDEEDPTVAPKLETPERLIHAQTSEIYLKIKKSRGFAGTSTPESKAKDNIEALLQQLVAYLNADLGIIDKKATYLNFGARGDWPDLQPESWHPVVEGLAAKRVPVPGSQEQ